MTRRRFPNARSRTLDFHRAIERSRYSGHRALDQCVEVVLLPVHHYTPLRLITAPNGGEASSKSHFVATIHHFLLLAFVKAFQDRRAPWYQRGLIRKPLRKIGVILLHNVERRFLGEIAMVLGK